MLFTFEYRTCSNTPPPREERVEAKGLGCGVFCFDFGELFGLFSSIPIFGEIEPVETPPPAFGLLPRPKGAEGERVCYLLHPCMLPLKEPRFHEPDAVNLRLDTVWF
jgi:hypothetical protein